MQAPPRAARVLHLEHGADQVLEHALLRTDGTALVDSSVVVRAAPRTEPDRLDALVAALSVGQAPGLAAGLADLGVGAVQVPADGDADLVTTLDMVPGLERMTEGDGILLWRVSVEGEPPPGWARLVDGAAADGERPATLAVLVSDGRTVRTHLPPAPSPDAPRTLVLATTADDAWHATVDGHALRAVEADGLAAFAVPPDGGHLVVEHVTARQGVWLGTGGLVLLVFVLLALPVGRRRGR